MAPGKGVSATVQARRVLCGNAAYLEENGVAVSEEALTQAARLRTEGKAVILVAQDNECVGAVALTDTVRPAAKGMVRELRDMDTGVVLLTGDHADTARYFAGQVGIDDVHAELLPAQKVEEVRRLQQQGRSICMIGDGVNDAPALKTADVGVAMGSMGSDIAVEAADIALMGDDIAKIPYLKRLSVATIKTIKFNITLSMCINLVAIVLSVTGIMGPIVGALWHNAGSVLVVLNAARLYDRKYTTPPFAPQEA